LERRRVIAPAAQHLRMGAFTLRRSASEAGRGRRVILKGESHHMVNRQILEGRWNELKGKIKERWGLLTDHELTQAEGDTDQLIGLIQQKTGASREHIEDELEDILATAEQANVAAREYAQRAAELAREQYAHLAENVRDGYAQAEDIVRRRPAESVAVAFGVGLITGVVVGMLTRRA
jgi:uncharacterized protein YjbJ (UPF0337 family)